MKSLRAFILVFTIIIFLLVGCNNKNQTGTTVSSPINTIVISTPPATSISAITPSSNTIPPSTSDIEAAKANSIIENNVIKADFIILGTITDFRYEKANDQSGNAVYTIFTLTIEKTIKGDPDTKEVFIQLPGGIVNDETGYYEVLPSRGYFSKDEKVLICLTKGENDYFSVMVPLGMLWAKLANGKEIIFEKANGEKLTLEWLMGFIIKTMRANNIPISFPQQEPIPEPAEPVHLPEKSKLP
jgi:hypothetical protein